MRQQKLRQVLGAKLRKARVWTVIAILIILTLVIALWRTNVVSAPTDDPRVDPIPTLDFDDPAKSMVVRLVFYGRDKVDLAPARVFYLRDKKVVLAPARVVFGRARAYIGDPPLLRVQVSDKHGKVIQQFNAWHPLWAFVEDPDGTRSRIILPHATGQFVFPFLPDSRTMRVFDVPWDRELISVDLGPAIRTFCQENPDDADCSPADGAVLGIQVWEPPAQIDVAGRVPVTVKETVVNNGPFGPVDFNVVFKAVARSDCEIVGPGQLVESLTLDVADETQIDATFVIHCLGPGIHALGFESQIAPVDPNVRDPDLTNNSGATGLFVGTRCSKCDINEDGVVDYKDLAILGAHYGKSAVAPYPRWDVDEDGAVGAKDLQMLAAEIRSRWASRGT